MLLLTIISAEQVIVSKEFPQKVFLKKSVHKKCPQKVSTQSFHKEFPQKVSTKSPPKKCPSEFSQKVSTK